MTFLEIYTEVARQARMNISNSAHLTSLQFWVNRAQEDLQNFNPMWWFLKDEYYLTTVASTRRYPFPTTNIDDDTSAMTRFDTDSFRSGSFQIPWVYPDDLDDYDIDWSVLTNTGTPRFVTVVGTNISLNIAPTDAWVADHPTIYFRGWKRLPTLAVVGDIPDFPAEWHNVLIQGALWRAWSERGVNDWNGARQLFYEKLQEMTARSRPTHGNARRSRAPRIFSLPSRGATNVGYY